VDRLPAVVVETAVVALLLAGAAAIRTTLGFIGEALFLIEGLFTFAEDEFGTAVFACDVFVWHMFMPPLNILGPKPKLMTTESEQPKS
jgi:hypothetical protein